MKKQRLSRRDFLRGAGLAGLGTALAAAGCQPKTVIVKETVVVEGTPKVVEKIVEKAVSAEQVVLTHTFWGSAPEWQLWVSFDDQFSAENADISVTSEHIPTDYENQIMLRHASGEMPEVLNMQDEPFPFYADKGVYTDLDPLVDRDAAELDLDDFFPQLLDMFKWHSESEMWLQGTQYAMPWDGAGILLYYNVDLFEQLGIDPPANQGWDWTMDDFLDTCLKIADFDSDGNMTRGAFLLPGWVYHMPFIMTMGGQYVDLENKKCMLDTPESIDAVQYYVDLRLKHHVCPYTTEFSGMGTTDLFREGQLGMHLTGPWWFPDLRAIPEEELRWDCLHFPKNPSTGERYVRQSWDGMAIGAGTEHVEQAWKYIKFVLSTEGQSRIAQLGRAMPARPSVAASEAFQDPNQQPAHEEVFLDAAEYYHVQPISLHWNAMWTIIGKYWEMMTLQDTQMPVAEGVDKICAGVNELFETGELPESY